MALWSDIGDTLSNYWASLRAFGGRTWNDATGDYDEDAMKLAYAMQTLVDMSNEYTRILQRGQTPPAQLKATMIVLKAVITDIINDVCANGGKVPLPIEAGIVNAGSCAYLMDPQEWRKEYAYFTRNVPTQQSVSGLGEVATGTVIIVVALSVVAIGAIAGGMYLASVNKKKLDVAAGIADAVRATNQLTAEGKINPAQAAEALKVLAEANGVADKVGDPMQSIKDIIGYLPYIIGGILLLQLLPALLPAVRAAGDTAASAMRSRQGAVAGLPSHRRGKRCRCK